MSWIKCKERKKKSLFHIFHRWIVRRRSLSLLPSIFSFSCHDLSCSHSLSQNSNKGSFYLFGCQGNMNLSRIRKKIILCLVLVYGVYLFFFPFFFAFFEYVFFCCFSFFYFCLSYSIRFNKCHVKNPIHQKHLHNFYIGLVLQWDFLFSRMVNRDYRFSSFPFCHSVLCIHFSLRFSPSLAFFFSGIFSFKIQQNLTTLEWKSHTHTHQKQWIAQKIGENKNCTDDKYIDDGKNK